MHPRLAAVAAAVALAATAVGAQPAVKAADSWVKAAADGVAETSAFVTIQNGTMYDVYIVGAETPVAGSAELHQGPDGPKPEAAKEVTVPAYDRLEMSADGVHLHLVQLKRALKPGDTASLSLFLDNGQTLTVDAIVK